MIFSKECTMPLEYCEYSGMTEKCRKWGEEHAPDALDGLDISEDNVDEKKHQKRGGKGTVKVPIFSSLYMPDKT